MDPQKINIPTAIIIAGLLIAGAVLITNTGTSTQTGTEAQTEKTAGSAQNPKEVFSPVSSDDYIRGSQDAEVVIVEYSDLECPYCQRFHGVMQNIIDEYDEDEVAWVYRHAPIAQLHSKAPREAQAAECAGELGGNTAFWDYVDQIFVISPTNNGLDLSLLPQVAEDIGLSRSAFEACLDEGKYKEKISAQLQNGIDTARTFGIRFGTPFSVLVTKDGELIPIQGAQSKEDVKALIEDTL